MITTGDLVKIFVTSESKSESQQIIKALSEANEVEQLLSPIPAAGDAGNGGDFGVVELVQEFIVAAAGPLTAEGLLSAVRAAVKRTRSSEDGHEPHREASQVDVQIAIPSEGVVELRLTIDKRD